MHSKKKFIEYVALTTTFSELLEKLENQDLSAASPTLLRHPYHTDEGDQRNQWEKDDQKIPSPNFCDMYSHVIFGLSESKGGTRHSKVIRRQGGLIR